MKRLSAAAVFGFFVLAAVARAELVEGKDYVRIDPRPVEVQGRIEVLEFFYYGCNACYELEPVLQEWRERRTLDVEFRRLPALRRAAWVPLTNLFFALEALGIQSKLHQRVFQAIHAQGKALTSRSELVDWVTEQGVDRLAFEEVLTSDAIAIRTQAARDATAAYGIRVTPSIVIDGRYLTTAEMLGQASRVATVLDQLVELARATRHGGRD